MSTPQMSEPTPAHVPLKSSRRAGKEPAPAKAGRLHRQRDDAELLRAVPAIRQVAGNGASSGASPRRCRARLLAALRLDFTGTLGGGVLRRKAIHHPALAGL